MKGFGKNPGVNTSFLKDEQKDAEQEIKRKGEMNRVRNPSLYPILS